MFAGGSSETRESPEKIKILTSKSSETYIGSGI